MNNRGLKRNKDFISKRKANFLLVVGLLFFVPIGMMVFIYFFDVLPSDDFVYVVIFGLFIFALLFANTNLCWCCIKVIKSEADVSLSEFYKMLNLYIPLKRIDKDGYGVEGIVEGREFDLLDKNDDGRILVSEYYPLTEAEVEKKILEVDKNFSKTEFKAFVKGLFMLVQKAISNNDYQALRAFEADSLYYQHKVIIEDFIKRGVVQKRENIRIKGVLLKDFKIDGTKEVIVVALTANMKLDCGNLFLEGDSCDVPYIMTFSRNKGVKTSSDIALSTSNCCNCGAVIDVDSDGVCNYCNTSLVSGELEWVLIDIKNITLIKG